MERHFLERIHIQAFGRFSDMTVGPFAPGLNVVYGKNEAGKTTLNAFVCGVLFGWENARGSKNVYKPAAAQRSGSLIFAARDQNKGTESTVELSRVHNKDGLIAHPAEACSLVDDIDKETYTTVFALTSDELRSLENAGDMTSRLLTAGSGTAVSPSEVLDEVDARIAQYTSRSAKATKSFHNLKKRMESCREQLAEARSRSDRYKDEDCERSELIVKRDAVAQELSQANDEVESLATLKVELQRLDEREARAVERRDTAQRDLASSEAAVKAAVNAGAGQISAADEAALRDAIDREQEAQIRAEHRLEAAQDGFYDARARYDAVKDAQDAKSSHTAKHPLTPFFAAIALAIIGVAWVLAGSLMSTSVFSAIGVVCFVAAVILAIVMAVTQRPGASRDSHETEQAYRTMVEKKSILDSRESELAQVNERINQLLTSVNLSDARGSLRRALELVDALREARMAYEQAQRRFEEATRMRDGAAAEIDDCVQQRKQALVARGFEETASLTEVEARAEQTDKRRDALTEQLESHNRRLGELNNILADAEHENSLDLLKTERAQISTLQEESGIELARLLLARRMLTNAIDAWESESQPEVYTRASELLSLMTDGAWRAVRMADSGSLCAIDAVGRSKEPNFLSLGTCQQLYLALRIALLECVESVGTNVPVLADDILVNFDNDRRLGAARALGELAAKRQVIVFTCHQEIVDLLSQRAGDCRVLAL